MSQIPPPQQPYQAPPPGAPAVEPHRGVLILVLGILSLALPTCGFIGIVAWIMGNTDMRKIQAGQMDRSGESLTQGGRVCGIIGSILFGLVLIGSLAYIVIVVVIIGVAAAAH